MNVRQAQALDKRRGVMHDRVHGVIVVLGVVGERDNVTTIDPHQLDVFIATPVRVKGDAVAAWRPAWFPIRRVVPRHAPQ